MPDSIAEQLAAPGGKDAFDQRIIKLLRADGFDEVQQLLLDGLKQLDTTVSRECLKVGPNSVTIDGWEYLVALITKLSKRETVTALGLALNDQHQKYEGFEPEMDIEFYSESCGFDFASASREDILSAGEKYPPSWLGGAFEGGNLEICCVGLSDLNEAMSNYWWLPKEERAALGNEGYAAVALGGWWLFLRYAEAMIEKLRTAGLPKKMPVLIGVSAERSTWIDIVFMCEKIFEDKGTTARIHAEEVAAQKAIFDKDTERQIAIWADARKRFRSLGLFVNPQKKAEVVKGLEMAEKLAHSANALVGISLPPSNRKTWDMGDNEFDTYARKFRELRNQFWEGKQRK